MTVIATTAYRPFRLRLQDEGLALTRHTIETVQINLGKRCNQACHHCHVDAGPHRTEMMDAATAHRVLALVGGHPPVRTVDLTGGAPELSPQFRGLVAASRGLGREVIDRCNLTVLLEPGQESTADFLKEQRAHVIASLPCYTGENVDAQRGGGVFARSIEALRLLNGLGYANPAAGLTLDLVYNPLGPSLPPVQALLEAEYREELGARFGIRFNRLFCITNMPISRFLHELRRTGAYDEYMTLLAASFNARAVAGVMCRGMISIGHDGAIYDCDFNQMLEIPSGGQRRTVWDIESLTELEEMDAVAANHCYGCTAGTGSSCGGALTG